MKSRTNLQTVWENDIDRNKAEDRLNLKWTDEPEGQFFAGSFQMDIFGREPYILTGIVF